MNLYCYRYVSGKFMQVVCYLNYMFKRTIFIPKMECVPLRIEKWKFFRTLCVIFYKNGLLVTSRKRI